MKKVLNVPWSHPLEFLNVYDILRGILEGNERDEIQKLLEHAVLFIRIWVSRMDKSIVEIESTLNFLECFVNDKSNYFLYRSRLSGEDKNKPTDIVDMDFQSENDFDHVKAQKNDKEPEVIFMSREAIKLIYSSSIVRFINGLVNTFDNNRNMSVRKIASRIGISPSIVDIRNEISHNKIPPLGMLRIISFRAFEWLYDNYWKFRASTIRNNKNNVRLHLEEYSKGFDCLTIYADMAYTSLDGFGKQQISSMSKNICDKLECHITRPIKFEQIISILLEKVSIDVTKAYKGGDDMVIKWFIFLNTFINGETKEICLLYSHIIEFLKSKYKDYNFFTLPSYDLDIRRHFETFLMENRTIVILLSIFFEIFRFFREYSNVNGYSDKSHMMDILINRNIIKTSFLFINPITINLIKEVNQRRHKYVSEIIDIIEDLIDGKHNRHEISEISMKHILDAIHEMEQDLDTTEHGSYNPFGPAPSIIQHNHQIL